MQLIKFGARWNILTDDGPKIIIEGTREDWPGGARTLTPRDPSLEPNNQTLWFGAELDPDGNQVWFRITLQADGHARRVPVARAKPGDPGELVVCP